MASDGSVLPPQAPGTKPDASVAAPAEPKVSTAAIFATMLRASKKVSDLIFSPGRAPQVEINGQLREVNIAGVGKLLPEATSRIANDLIGRHEIVSGKLEKEGAADLSYSLPGVARFRVNVFRQRGTYAIVMRVIPQTIPDFAALNLPPHLGEIAELRNGIVLVTGPTGSGKSSTLAAILNKINEEKAYHILTIEDPIEFLHRHKKSTIHQRELHSDTPSFVLALRAALRQAPKVILVGEMRDRETIEIALEAAETGHLVLSTLHTIDASKTVARIAAVEILKSTMRTREYVEKGESEGKSLLDAMRDGSTEGMQYFEGEIDKLIRAGIVDFETGISFSTNAGNLRLEMADFLDVRSNRPAASKPAAHDPNRTTEIEIER